MTVKEKPMIPETLPFSSGDRIVHRYHGVGQIKGTEVMNIGGQKNTYCRIQTGDSIYWMPVEKLNADLLRPLASSDELQQALEVLTHSPSAMDADPTVRNGQIKKAKLDFSTVVVAEIIRDLWAHNKAKKQASQTDMEALRYFTGFFLTEWSVCMNLDMGVIKQRLNDMLTQAWELRMEESQREQS